MKTARTTHPTASPGAAEPRRTGVESTPVEAVNPARPADPDMAIPYGELLSGPALFVVLLSVVFLVFPCFYLYRALAERGVFGRVRP